MIVKLQAVYKDYLWGGEKLRSHYHKSTDMSPLAESWEVSCHPDGESTLISGPHKGWTLAQYVSHYPEFLGKKAQQMERFPILVKFIDAKLALSVQVHPDDAYGMRVENEPGKTEVWYVLEAEKNAELIMGFERECSKEEVLEAIERGKLMDLLHREAVAEGDVFFIESGTVHGIGAGITLIEIQQNSNTTYRVYDYDRVDKAGNKRPLHLSNALACMNYRPVSPIKHKLPVIASCEYFHVEAYDIFESCQMTTTSDTFQSMTCVSGMVRLTQEDIIIDLQKGESAFITAEESAYQIEGRGKVVIASI